jgi:hypothetical protein
MGGRKNMNIPSTDTDTSKLSSQVGWQPAPCGRQVGPPMIAPGKLSVTIVPST